MLVPVRLHLILRLLLRRGVVPRAHLELHLLDEVEDLAEERLAVADRLAAGAMQRVRAALGVADLDKQYDLMTHDGGALSKLSQLPAMLHTLTKKDMDTIRDNVEAVRKKVSDDPMTPRADALAAL